ncbi:N-acetyltransferase ESCO2-like [Mercenaria mercenaria]|uniref:N-acetyltransferase ESCO2-like n=1 Tax=Mercenaria mercenaria TaxID=6596 RepID=UPI00234ED2C6|nr:N-acetyltransferase ESCO2-like [Mercenaria mercenaria]XP_053395372.1 N-acetyltransferase ESCO2-like [Mercenaria mercenaria]
METRHQRKRRWQSSPGKKARMELDFGQNTPSPKRIKLGTPAVPPAHHGAEIDADSFTIKSFYGKREKISFPHSPGRRKAVDKVLEKISDENTDSENDRPARKKNVVKKHDGKNESDMSRFDFHSSDSGDTENEGQTRPVLRQKNAEHGSNKKVPLDIVKVKKTPKNNSGKKLKVPAKSTGKIPNKVDKDLEQERTPMITGKKFFKSRSPASADKCFGNLVIKKGFDLKFYPKRLNLSGSKSEKPKSASKSKKTKPRPVDKVNAYKAKGFDKDSVFFVDDSVKPDGTELSDSQMETLNESRKTVTYTEEEQVNEKLDSGIETANSNDLFSSSPDLIGGDENHIEKESEKNLMNEGEKNSEISSDTVSLIGAGSEDLFSSSGRCTPVNELSGECTPLEQTPVQSKQGSPSGSSEIGSAESGTGGSSSVKLFPIFLKKSPSASSQLGKLRGKRSPRGTRSPGGSSNNSPLLRYVKSKDNLEQMIIDAGQKKFGATQCEVCGMVYTMSEPADEAMHVKFHQSLLNVLKFPGWKKEHVVQEYMDTGSRVIMVTAESPKYATRKVEEINKVMGEELGFAEPTLSFRASYKAFLYVSEDKKIEGCCVVEPINEGYRVLPDTQSSQSAENHPGHRPWCSSDQAEPAVVGVSRIWVYGQARRKGIASKLLDCVRQWSIYGTVIPKNKMAFSDPTPDGKQLATRYIGTPTFLVYKYQ